MSNHMYQLFQRVRFNQAFAFFLMVAVFGYFYFYSFATITPDQRQACREIIIAMVGIAGTVVSFHFGSSVGSARKDEAIKNALSNPQQIKVDNIETVNTNKGTEDGEEGA